VSRPLAIDLFAGLSGWGEGLLAEGWRVVAFDIVDMFAELGVPKHDGDFQLVLQDALTLHGSQFRNAGLIVCSPPCQFFSYCAMPWTRAKQLAAEVRADPQRLAKETALFNACFRIQREACEAAGRHIPLIVENVRGAQPWVGRARWAWGSFYLWGDVPALMPVRYCGENKIAPEVNEAIRNGQSPTRWTNPAEWGTKIGGSGNKLYGRSGFTVVDGKVSFSNRQLLAYGLKQGGTWWHDEGSISRTTSSKSPARKAASALIAKIPTPLARWLGRAYRPVTAT
jgi:hypothetical protein